jgi:hypothetical protein
LEIKPLFTAQAMTVEGIQRVDGIGVQGANGLDFFDVD